MVMFKGEGGGLPVKNICLEERKLACQTMVIYSPTQSTREWENFLLPAHPSIFVIIIFKRGVCFDF
jgi:hypothetical protein